MQPRICKLLFVCCGVAASPVLGQDFGFPVLNTAGRYFGVGWSHHTYHSTVNGRLNVLDRRHPASDYPSRNLSHPYFPGYWNHPVNGPIGGSPVTYWAPTRIPGGFQQQPFPTLAPDPVDRGRLGPRPELEAEDVPSTKVEDAFSGPNNTTNLPSTPLQPPPVWLKPYLEQNSAPKLIQPEIDDSDLLELQSSPSDRSTPRSAGFEPMIINRYRIR